MDVIRKYNDGNLYSAFIIENQSCADPCGCRAAVYEYVAYERMLKRSRKRIESKEKTTNGAHSGILYRKGSGMRPD